MVFSEEKMQDKKYFFIGLVAGLMLMTGITAGYTTLRSHIRWGSQIPPETKISHIYDMLETHSINPYDRDELMNSMYRGMLYGVGDPYTYYFDKEALETFTIQTEGMYVGIGVVVTTDPADRATTIVTVYPETPAQAAGIQPGDKIIRVDNQEMAGKAMSEVIAAVKGRAGTKVRITLYRPSTNETIEVTVDRENISIPTVSHKMLDGVIGYIRIEGFERVTLGQFATAFEDLQSQQMRVLIIDVRNNPGGLLDTVTQIANILLPEGVITYTENKSGERKYYNSDKNHVNMPVVMLVNENSASASEVLSGAVRDLGMGVLVGAKTFGKGIVQNLYPLSDGSAVKITVAKYYTPSGVCIQGEGLVPDYTVEVDPEMSFKAGTLELDEDKQLQKAVEVAWGLLAS
jgi:carboxyl-terminal processing protease